MNLAFFWWWLEPPKRGGHYMGSWEGRFGKKGTNFFYLKLDIKSKLFTDAILSRTKKKFYCPIYYK